MKQSHNFSFCLSFFSPVQSSFDIKKSRHPDHRRVLGGFLLLCYYRVHSPLHTANKGQVRIQCLVPIYVFRNETVQPPYFQNRIITFCPQFLHSNICERFIYFQDRSVNFAAANYVDRSWEYINRSQTHE
jgi:hypothetical protein